MGIAIDEVRTEAMSELVQQHGQEQEPHHDGGIDPRMGVGAFAFLERHAQNDPQGNERKQHMNPDGDTKQPGQRHRPG